MLCRQPEAVEKSLDMNLAERFGLTYGIAFQIKNDLFNLRTNIKELEKSYRCVSVIIPDENGLLSEKNLKIEEARLAKIKRDGRVMTKKELSKILSFYIP